MRKCGKRESGPAQRMEHYRSADINDKLIINLRDLNRTMHSLYEGKGSQKRILIVMNEVGTITQRELTERLDIQPGSASEVLAKLEHAGLILRTPSENDRRTTDVVLTEEGRRRAAEATEQRNQRHEEMFSCLADEEKRQLLTLLEKIYADWTERYQDVRGQREHGEFCHGHHGHGHHGEMEKRD